MGGQGRASVNVLMVDIGKWELAREKDIGYNISTRGRLGRAVQ